MARWDRSRGTPEPIRALNKIIERESGEPLVYIPEVAPSLVLVRPQLIPYCRESVAQMAESAAKSLPDGVFLGLLDAWRPFERQKRIHDWMLNCAREAHPEASLPVLMRKANRWAAPYTHKAPPGHCTGGALDVWLVDGSGEQIDVTSPFGRFEAAPTYVFGLTETAQNSRNMLVEAMTEAGFSNCRDEWWHYSYGDAAWAVRTGRSEAIFGLVDLPLELYEDQEELWQEAHQQRPNPFLPGS